MLCLAYLILVNKCSIYSNAGFWVVLLQKKLWGVSLRNQNHTVSTRNLKRNNQSRRVFLKQIQDGCNSGDEMNPELLELP